MALIGAGAGYKRASEKTDKGLEEMKTTIENAKEYSNSVDEEVSKVDKEVAIESIGNIIDFVSQRESKRPNNSNTTIR